MRNMRKNTRFVLGNGSIIYEQAWRAWIEKLIDKELISLILPLPESTGVNISGMIWGGSG